MAINRSSFTEANNWEIDSFTELYDLSPSQLAQAQRYQLLKMKASKTQLEITELNTLSLALKDYLITPERWNKFSDALVNMEILLSTEIMDYIEAMQLNVETFTNTKKGEMDAHIVSEKTGVTTFVNGKQTQIQTTVDNALVNIEQKKANIIEYMDGTTAGQIRNDIGIMGDLSTTSKNLVSAINEVNAKEVDMTPVNNHIADKANPHDVTATQVGAYTKLETDNKLGILSGEIDVHESEDRIAAHKAKNIALEDATGKFVATELEGAMLELFQFANNGKTDIATVVGSPATSGNTFTQLKTHIQNSKNALATNLTDKGQSSVGTETLNALVSKVLNVNTGKKFATGLQSPVLTGGQYMLTVTGLTFIPSIILMYGATNKLMGNFYTKLDTDTTSYVHFSSGAGSIFKSVTLYGGYVQNGGFSLNIPATGSQRWIAVE